MSSNYLKWSKEEVAQFFDSKGLSDVGKIMKGKWDRPGGWIRSCVLLTEQVHDDVFLVSTTTGR